MNHETVDLDDPMGRKQWAAMLGAVCSPSFPADAVEALTDMLPLLMGWGDQYFTARTIREIGMMKRRQSCPSLDEINRVFGEQMRGSLPVAVRMGTDTFPALPAPQTREPTEAEVAHVAARVAEAKAFLAIPDASMRLEEKVRPLHLTKLQLALTERSRGVPAAQMRPDLRAALEQHGAQSSDDFGLPVPE